LLHAFLVHYPLVVSIRDAIIAGSTGRMAMILLIYGGVLATCSIYLRMMREKHQQ